MAEIITPDAKAPKVFLGPALAVQNPFNRRQKKAAELLAKSPRELEMER